MTKAFSGKIPEWIRKYKYPALILALGLALMLIPTGKRDPAPSEAVPQIRQAPEGFDLKTFTDNAQDLLARVSGAGQVRVMFSLDTDGETHYLSDEVIITQEGSREHRRETAFGTVEGDETPVSRMEIYPSFRGALVLAQGAEDPQVVLGLKEAISSLTGLGMDKITVLKMD